MLAAAWSQKVLSAKKELTEVSVDVIERRRFITIHIGLVVASEERLVEDGSRAADKVLLASAEAHVIHAATRLLVGVHAGVELLVVAREGRLGDLRGRLGHGRVHGHAIAGGAFVLLLHLLLLELALGLLLFLLLVIVVVLRRGERKGHERLVPRQNNGELMRT